MRITFIDRGRELNFLEERYRSHKAEIVVCGCRRVGKTFLLRRFLSGKRGVHFVISRLGNVLQEISEEIDEQLGVHPPLLRNYSDLFSYITRESYDERMVLVIDEFQQLKEHDQLPHRTTSSLG